jgi:hypothetical protein
MQEQRILSMISYELMAVTRRKEALSDTVSIKGEIRTLRRQPASITQNEPIHKNHLRVEKAV